MRYLFAIILTLALALPCFAEDVNVRWDYAPDADGYKLQIGNATVSPIVWGEIRDVGLPPTVMVTENNATKEIHEYTWVGWPSTGRWVVRTGAYNLDGMEAWQVQNYPSLCLDCAPPSVPTGTHIE